MKSLMSSPAHGNPSGRQPASTFAIIVAVTEIPGFELPNAKLQAFRFLEYLRKRRTSAGDVQEGVPPGNIRMFGSCFLAPQARASLDALGIRADQVSAANRAEVFSFLQSISSEWRNADNADLMFYWVGHGFEGDSGERRLVYEDFRSDNPVNLDIRKLMSLWRNSHGTQFSNQLGFVDSCARTPSGKLSSEEFPISDVSVLQARQNFYFGSSNGEAASDGVFSEALIGQVLCRLQPGEWPPGQQTDLWAKVSALKLEGSSPMQIVVESDTGGGRYKWLIGNAASQSWGWAALGVSVLLFSLPLMWWLRVENISDTLPKWFATSVSALMIAYNFISPDRKPWLKSMYILRRIAWTPWFTIGITLLLCVSLYVEFTLPLAKITNRDSGDPVVMFSMPEGQTPIRFAEVAQIQTQRIVHDSLRMRQRSKWGLQLKGAPLHCITPQPAPFVVFIDNILPWEFPLDSEKTCPAPLRISVMPENLRLADTAKIRLFISIGGTEIEKCIAVKPGAKILIASTAVESTAYSCPAGEEDPEDPKGYSPCPTAGCLIAIPVGCTDVLKKLLGLKYEIRQAGSFTPTMKKMGSHKRDVHRRYLIDTSNAPSLLNLAGDRKESTNE